MEWIENTCSVLRIVVVVFDQKVQPAVITHYENDPRQNVENDTDARALSGSNNFRAFIVLQREFNVRSLEQTCRRTRHAFVRPRTKKVAFGIIRFEQSFSVRESSGTLVSSS
jgi:hypothetical protein